MAKPETEIIIVTYKHVQNQDPIEEETKVPVSVFKKLVTAEEGLSDLNPEYEKSIEPVKWYIYGSVSKPVLDLIIEWINEELRHPTDQSKDKFLRVNLTPWETSFRAKLSMDNLFLVFIAANYLGVVGLVDLCSRFIADIIEVTPPNEIQTVFAIPPESILYKVPPPDTSTSAPMVAAARPSRTSASAAAAAAAASTTDTASSTFFLTTGGRKGVRK